MKKLRALLFPFLLSIGPAAAMELNVSIENLIYAGGDFKSLERKTEIGSMNAKSFRIKTEDTRFSLQSGYQFNAQVFADSEWLYLSNEIFDFSYSLESLPFLKNIEKLDIQNVSAYTDESNFFLSSEMANAFLSEETIQLNNVFLSCGLEENIISGSKKVLESCLNKSRFSKSNNDVNKETRIDLAFGESNAGFNLTSGIITDSNLDFTVSNLGATFGSFSLGADSINLECSKSHYTKDVTSEEIVRHCLKDANIIIPELAFSDNEMKLQGLVSIDTFLADGEKLKFKGRSVDVTYDDLSILINELDASCFLPSLDENFKFSHISEGCMTGSSFELEELGLNTSESVIEMGHTKLDVKEDRIELVSPLITLKDKVGTLRLDIIDSEISCKKVSNDEPTLESILRGCFDSSKLTIPKIKVAHADIDSNIIINKIALDKNKIAFNSPRGSYTLNGIENKFKNMKLDCDLSASYDMAKNLDWKSILSNCLHSTTFNIQSLIGVYNGDSFWRKFGNKLSTFGIKAIRHVKYSSKNKNADNFTMKISPEVLGFIPINATVKGKINFDREKEEIKIKIKNVKFYKIIPAKFLVQIILMAFFQEDNIEVDGSRITISLK